MIDGMEEYFAAFVKVSNECDPKKIISQLKAHGADFVFMDLSQND